MFTKRALTFDKAPAKDGAGAACEDKLLASGGSMYPAEGGANSMLAVGKDKYSSKQE